MKTKLLTTSALVLGAFCSPVFAQDAAEPEASDSRTLQTVRITATKREQTLQDVPVAVSVVDAETIQDAEILDLNDLQSIVPSLRFNQLQNSANSTFIIRGFGNGANNVGIEPSVGVFIDGVYRSRAQAAIADLPNLERVEVLRGPQSTLFGKNASAGVVSIVTAAPSLDGFTGSIEGGLSNYNGNRAKAYVSGPISETVAFSLGGNYNKRDGFAENAATGEDLNERNRWGVRGELLWEPNADASFRLIADFDEIDEACCVANNLIEGPASTVIRLIGGQIDSEDTFAREVFLNGEPENVVENSGVSLTGEYDFDGFTLTSITALRQSERANNYDIDYSSARLATIDETVDLETFTQEIRLTSNGDGNFDWLLGGYFFDESADIGANLLYREDFRNYIDLSGALGAAAPADVPGIIAAFQAGTLPSALGGLEAGLGLPNGTFAANGQGNTERFTQEDQAWSVFGSLDFHLTDRLTATLGANYTENEKDVTAEIIGTDVLSDLDLTQVGYALVLPAVVGVATMNPNATLADAGALAATDPLTYAFVQQQALAIASNYDTSTGPNTFNPLVGLQPLQFQPQFVGIPNAVESGSTSVDELTYNFRLAYDLTDNINVYGSYGTGFKSNSWNLSRDSRPTPDVFIPDFDPVTQQSVGTVVDPVTGDVLRLSPSSPLRDAGLAENNLTTGTRFADPEEATVLEFGLKGAWDTFAINLAIFDQKIEGFQSNVFTGTGFALANADEQSTMGIEVDASWSPIQDLTLTFAGTFMDPEYDTFLNSAFGDISGTTPSGIAETSTTLGGSYGFDVISGWRGLVRADWQYESDTDFFDGEDANPTNDLFDMAGISREVNNVNASLGFTSDNGLGITFWGRNIFDHERTTTAFPGVAQDGTWSGYPNQPTTYGVTVRKSW